ncbi:MAG: copper chaperone PCu(A)C [Chloroflexi bacterium]|nr:copper chaperone PCu(A)C [Chloroflexota bacterium]
MKFWAGGVLILCLLLTSGCGGGAGSQGPTIQVSDAWARAVNGGANVNSAAYMSIRNTGKTADRLVAVVGDVAGAVELHKTEMKDGVMKMAPVEGGIDVPAGGEAQLKPGGLHVMLIGVQRDLKADEKITLKLQFEKAGEIAVEVQVRNP